MQHESLRLDVNYFADLIWLVLRDMPFPHTDAAVPLLLGIAAQESGLCNIRQAHSGPARGVFQMEPQTAKEHVEWLLHQPDFKWVLPSRCGMTRYTIFALEENLLCQIVLCRTHIYRRDPQQLPPRDDLEAQATCWKVHYNTDAGAGTVKQYKESYQRLVLPALGSLSA